MSAWIIIGIVTFVLLFALIFVGRLPRKTWEITAAALVLGLTGYALQGQSSLEGAPAEKPAAAKEAAGAELITMRADMSPNFNVSRQWTITSDSLARNGKYSLAIAYVQSGLKRHPENAHFWSAMGLYSMLASDGRMSEPAKFAFARARTFDKTHPAPDYFEGLSALFDGRAAETLEKWTNASENAPKDAKWKPRLDGQLAALVLAANQAVKEQKPDVADQARE